MMRTLQKSLSLGLLAALFMTACATAQTDTTTSDTTSAAQTAPMVQLKSVWKNMTYGGHPHKFMVLGVAKDPAERAVFEDAFVHELKAHGVEAVASHTLLADKLQKTVWAINEQISSQGSDAVLVTRLVSKQDAQIFVPETVFRPQIYYDTWSEFFGYSYQALYMPNAIADGATALLETNVYDARNMNLVWAGTSATEMASSDKNTIKAGASAMVNAMASKSLLGK